MTQSIPLIFIVILVGVEVLDSVQVDFKLAVWHIDLHDTTLKTRKGIG